MIINTYKIIACILLVLIGSSIYTSNMFFPIKVICILITFVFLALICGILINRYIKKYTKQCILNCEFNKCKKFVNDHLRSDEKKYINVGIMREIMLCNAFLNNVDIFENEVKLLSNSSKNVYVKLELDNLFYLASIYNIIGDYEKIPKIKNDIYEILRNKNIDKYFKNKEKVINRYNDVSCMVDANNNIKDTEKQKILLDIFKRKIDESKSVLEKVVYNYQMILVYERIGNREEAKKCAKYVLENHGDFYLNSKIISKYVD